MKLFRNIFLLLLVAFTSQTLLAQKVGLVLSGGGAKGLYHIGIIKALEENSIPIDYVSGTSMGSIVAGMYAAGYSAKEMEDIFDSDIVSFWIKGKIEDKYKYYYKQPEPTPAMLRLNLDLMGLVKGDNLEKDLFESGQDTTKKEVSYFKKKLITLANKKEKESDGRLKTYSMYSSVQLDLAMTYFYSAASAYAKNNFDSLFVPFRCVSVDIYKKKQYVWKDGSLPMAIRSSMAIPIVFKPIAVDTMLMYDGGLQNNFPWQEMKEEFNPDIIIGGVCVSGKTDLSSAVSQLEMLVMNETNYGMPSDVGIMIKRNVDVGMLDYKRAKEIIDMGYADAIKMMPKIKERIERKVSPEEVYIRRLAFKESMPVLEFSDFEIGGLTPKQREYIERQFNQKKKSEIKETISYEEFKADYLDIIDEDVMEGDFPVADFKVDSGLFVLDVNMYSKPSFKAMVGLNISSSSVNEAYIGLHYRSLGRISKKYMLDSYIGSFYSSVKLGARYNFYGGKNPYYIEPSLVYNYYDYGRGNSQRISYSPKNIDYSKYNDIYGSVAMGLPVTQSSKLEARVSYGADVYKYITSKEVESLSPSKSKNTFASLNVSLSRNNLNYLMFPTVGVRERLAIFGTYAKETFTRSPEEILNDFDNFSGGIFQNLYAGASYQREEYFEISKTFNVGYQVDALYSSHREQSSDFMQSMTDPIYQPTAHSKTMYIPEFASHRYVAAGVKPIFKITEQFYLKATGYAFMPDFGNFEKINDRLRYIFSSTLAYQSPIGAISFNYSRYFNVQSVRSDYFTLNIGVSMFNKKGIIY